MRSHWLFVSKPIEAPLRDGTQVLAAHIVRHLDPRFFITYFGDPAWRAGENSEALRAPRMEYAPAALAKLRMLGVLAEPRYRRTPLHFFFTPNTATSSVVALLKRIAPARPIVQSVMSSARAVGHAKLLAPLDAVIVLSRHAQRQLAAAGLPDERLHCIYPAVAAGTGARAPDAANRILFAGDLDERVVERLVRVMRGIRAARERPWWKLTIASRPKAPRDAEHREKLAQLLAPELAAGRAELLGEVPDMRALWRDTALQVFVADHVERKVDLPLVLLEGLAEGVPLVALDFAPLNEIFALARRHRLDVGDAVRADDGAALEAVVRDWLGDHARRGRAGADAERLADLEFSLPAMAGRYAALYDQLETHDASVWQHSRSSAR